jgi:hypothetical protein
METELRADPPTASALDAIAQLKSAGPDVLACEEAASATPSHGDAQTPIDGGWSACPTVDEIVAAGGDAGEARGNAGCVTLTFNRGTFSESGASADDARPGSYALEGNQLTIERANGERFAFTVNFFREALILSSPRDPKGVSPAPWRAVPFSRVGG